MEAIDTAIYDVVFFWDSTKNDLEYKQYCSETLCNILGYTPGLSVKLVYEAVEKKKSLIYSTRNVDKAIDIRNTLAALHMNCQVSPV